MHQDISTDPKETHQNHILKYLSEKFEGIVHTKNVVKITASSIFNNNDRPVQNIVEEDDNK